MDNRKSVNRSSCFFYDTSRLNRRLGLDLRRTGLIRCLDYVRSIILFGPIVRDCMLIRE